MSEQRSEATDGADAAQFGLARGMPPVLEVFGAVCGLLAPLTEEERRRVFLAVAVLLNIEVRP